MTKKNKLEQIGDVFLKSFTSIEKGEFSDSVRINAIRNYGDKNGVVKSKFFSDVEIITANYESLDGQRKYSEKWEGYCNQGKPGKLTLFIRKNSK